MQAASYPICLHVCTHHSLLLIDQRFGQRQSQIVLCIQTYNANVQWLAIFCVTRQRRQTCRLGCRKVLDTFDRILHGAYQTRLLRVRTQDADKVSLFA